MISREEEYYTYNEDYSDRTYPEGPPPDYQSDFDLDPDNRFSVKHKGVIRKNIVYNPAKPNYYNCDQRVPFSLAPLEMGVIWTRAGPVTAGSVLSGLAAGFEPHTEYWPSTGQNANSRKIDGIYATTMAAELAQTALMKKRGQKYTGPDGYFNNSVCPSEFLLTSFTNNYGEPTFTHLTIAEINGAIDGLILGLIAKDINRRSEYSLSQVSTTDRVNTLMSLINVGLRLFFLRKYSRPYAVIPDPTFIYF